MLKVTLDTTLLRPMRTEDWDSVRAIFEEGMATGIATFETNAPSWAQWDSAHRTDCRWVACASDGTILGWAALSPVSARQVYAGVAEVSLYIAANARGQGLGARLLNTLIDDSERAGLWTVQAVIFAVNSASITLHERCGFRLVGRRERIGQRNGIWHDTVLMERRSAKVAPPNS